MNVVSMLVFLCSEHFQVRHDVPRTGVDELYEDVLGIAHVLVESPTFYFTKGLCNDIDRLGASRLVDLLQQAQLRAIDDVDNWWIHLGVLIVVPKDYSSETLGRVKR